LAAQRAEDGAVDHDNPLEEVFEDQILCADLILLNKCDALIRGRPLRVRAEIAAHLPKAIKIVEASHGRIEPALSSASARRRRAISRLRPSHHESEADHDHDDFDSAAFALPKVAAPEDLAARVGKAAEAEGVLRVKGFAAVADKPMRLVIQGVGRRIAHHYDRPVCAGEPREGKLVVIGLKGFDRGGRRRRLAD
jgi:cobalamin biosynthesis protein CobW